MNNRKVQEPFTLRKHSVLQNEINVMMMAIKLYHVCAPDLDETPEVYKNWEKAKANYKHPTWETILDILQRSYKALDEQRYNPIKY